MRFFEYVKKEEPNEMDLDKYYEDLKKDGWFMCKCCKAAETPDIEGICEDCEINYDLPKDWTPNAK